MLLELPPTLHHPVECALLHAVEPVRVVELARAVDAQAYQKIVLLEEGTPLVIEQDAVGLKGVFHDLFRSAVLFDKFDRTAEEIELHERRLASLPCHRHRGSAV